MGNKFKESLRRLIAGRDGKLILLLAVFLVFTLLTNFIEGTAARVVISLIQLALAIVMLYELLKLRAERNYSRFDALDGLHIFLLCLLSILSMSVKNVFVQIPVSLLQLALIISVLVHLFTMNTAKREEKNRKFLQSIKPVTDYITLQYNRFRDRKTHVYRKCPKCGAVLRLPKTSGEHTVKCPRCAERFEVRVK